MVRTKQDGFERGMSPNCRSYVEGAETALLLTDRKDVSIEYSHLAKTDLRAMGLRDKLRARGRTLSSVVEHYLHTVGVVGSKPTASTIFSAGKFTFPVNVIPVPPDSALTFRMGHSP